MRPPFHLFDNVGRDLLMREGDVVARLHLLDLSEAQYDAGELDGSAMLLHAELYLADRIGYEMAPAPKNAIPVHVGGAA